MVESLSFGEPDRLSTSLEELAAAFRARRDCGAALSFQQRAEPLLREVLERLEGDDKECLCTEHWAGDHWESPTALAIRALLTDTADVEAKASKSTAAELLGAIPDITGDLSTEEHLRRIRGGQPT